MTMTVEAVYAGGVLRPVQPLALAEGETVQVTIAPASTTATTGPVSEEEIIRRIQACKTYGEWLEVTKLLPPDDGGYDIVKALGENRRWSLGPKPGRLKSATEFLNEDHTAASTKLECVCMCMPLASGWWQE